MATLKTPTGKVPPLNSAQEALVRDMIAGSSGSGASGLSEDNVKDMIADAAVNAEHHARASVTSNELQLFAAMAQQGMLANRSNAGMDPDKMARAAVMHAEALVMALTPVPPAEPEE